MSLLCEDLRMLGMPISASVSHVDLDQALSFLVGMPTQIDTLSTQAKCIQTLVEWGGDIEGADTNGATLLMRAIASNSLHLNLLVDLGAKIEAVDSQGRNAWHYIALHGAMDYEHLAKPGQDRIAINARDNAGRTPLWHGCQQTVLAKGVPALLECGADIGLTDQEGCNGWFYAATSACSSTLLPLLAHHDPTGVHINARNHRREMPSNHLANQPAHLAFLQSCGGFTRKGDDEDVKKVIHFADTVARHLSTTIDDYRRENARALEQLAQACGSPPDSLKYQSYGSEAGNQYFQAYKKRVVIPALADAFSFLQTELPDLQAKHPQLADAAAMAIFKVVTHHIGNMRAHIAEVTRSTQAAEFGRPIFIASLRDPVDAFPGWMQAMKGRFHGFLKEAFQNIRGAPTPEHLVEALIGLNCTVIQDVEEAGAFVRFSFQIPSGPFSGIFLGHVSLKPKRLETLEASDIEGPFVESTSRNGDEQPASISIDCHHEAIDVQHIHNLAQSFVKALTWTEDLGQTALKRSLHDFLSQFHVTSLWHRGQASAAQIFVEVFGDLHRHDLVFPSRWHTDPLRQNMSTDQQFLSDFDDRDTSFDKFDKQVRLVPRTSSNSSNASNA